MQVNKTHVSHEGCVKYVFVCGVHRSGTTILAQSIGELKNCTGFQNTGANMDEGQHLQNVYSPDYIYGGVGRFGFAPQVHLTEESSLLTEANMLHLRQNWEKYWDRDKTIKIEKTPGNLLMTRFLQAAFCPAYFVVIKRHPVAVSLASQKWSRSSLHNLFEHWLRCYAMFEEDKKYLNNVYELSYEDYVEKPQEHLKRIAAFVGTEWTPFIDKTPADHNRKYFARWDQLLERSPFKWYYRTVATAYSKYCEQHGYSLWPNRMTAATTSDQQTPIGRLAAPLLYLGADAYWVLLDVGLRLRASLRWIAKQYCPVTLRVFLRDCRATLSRRDA